MQFSAQWPGYSSSTFELVGFLGALIAGYISDRLLDGRLYRVGETMLFLLAAWLLINPVIGQLGPGAMALSVSVPGILIYSPDLLMSGPASVDAMPAGHATRAAGIVNGVGSLGQLLSAYVVAVVVSRFGWDQLFTFFLMFAVTAGSLLTLRWDKGKDWKGVRNPNDVSLLASCNPGLGRDGGGLWQSGARRRAATRLGRQ